MDVQFKFQKNLKCHFRSSVLMHRYSSGHFVTFLKSRLATCVCCVLYLKINKSVNSRNILEEEYIFCFKNSNEKTVCFIAFIICFTRTILSHIARITYHTSRLFAMKFSASNLSAIKQ